ncbi:uncharacterized protein LOC115959787 [Quercus lobata]|uniref:uncharacterized protein LOC115959787 n=1 Tax=Quercus lobata TaxID=97700 RepID=UPI001248873E|nr:uncharacterized protein LOC115959787 [Quercus lobata]
MEVECDLCGGVETVGHTFWGCDFVAAVWQMANVKAPGLMTNPSNFLDLFWCIMEAKPDQDLEASATTAWFLWNNGNAARHGESSRTALQIFKASRLYLVEFQTHCNSPQAHQPHAPYLWRPPPPGWYKTNVNGVVFKERGQYGIGVVIRNDKGQIMGALSKTLPYPLGALETKAKAAEIGIIFSWELGPREIILEGDSQIVMNVIANHDPGPIQIQQFVAGIKY